MSKPSSNLVHLYDTTLRDGTQGEGINFSTDDKVRIARLLDEIGFSYIEGGYPASNDRDRDFLQLCAASRCATAGFVRSA